MKQTTTKTVVIENEYDNGQKTYNVKFITTTFIKNIFIEKTKVDEVIDEIVFYSKEAAEKYAEVMEMPSNRFKKYYTHYDYIENKYCQIVQVFPFGHKELWKQGKYIAYFVDQHNNGIYMMVDDNAMDNEDESIRDDVYKCIYNYDVSLNKDSKFLKYKIPIINLSKNYVANILKNYTYKSSPVKIFMKYDLETIEDNDVSELTMARHELIKKEIERIDKYKEFLLSFK